MADDTPASASSSIARRPPEQRRSPRRQRLPPTGSPGTSAGSPCCFATSTPVRRETRRGGRQASARQRRHVASPTSGVRISSVMARRWCCRRSDEHAYRQHAKPVIPIRPLVDTGGDSGRTPSFGSGSRMVRPSPGCPPRQSHRPSARIDRGAAGADRCDGCVAIWRGPWLPVAVSMPSTARPTGHAVCGPSAAPSPGAPRRLRTLAGPQSLIRRRYTVSPGGSTAGTKPLLVPRQATFARLTSSRRARSCALRLRRWM